MPTPTNKGQQREPPDKSYWLLAAALAYPVLNWLGWRAIGEQPFDALTFFGLVAPSATISVAAQAHLALDSDRWAALTAFALWIAFIGFLNYVLFFADFAFASAAFTLRRSARG